MKRIVIDGTEWHGKFVTYFEGKTTMLGETKVVGVRRRTPANETRKSGKSFQVIFVAISLWRRQSETRFIDWHAQ